MGLICIWFSSTLKQAMFQFQFQSNSEQISYAHAIVVVVGVTKWVRVFILHKED